MALTEKFKTRLLEALAKTEAQTEKAQSSSKLTCYYRHPKDSECRCVVGHMIPDENYDSKIEENDVLSLLRYWPKILGFELAPEEFALLTEVQETHDNDWQPGQKFPFEIYKALT